MTLKIAFGALLLTCLTTLALADENPVGFQSSTLADSHNDRSLEMVVWYPSATAAATQLIGDDAVFVGASAVPAAINHPGTTTHDRSPQAATQLWLRPVDLRRAIDTVTTQPEKFGLVANNRITVVGHSLGGWTALEIAGARFDPDRFAHDCKAHPQLSSCTVYGKINPASTSKSKAALTADLRDKRVTAVVTLDLGLSRGLTE